MKKKQKQFEVQRDRIKALFGHWLRVLGLRWWTTDIFYHNELNPIGDNKFIFAHVDADWRYMKATIDVWVPTADKLNDAELEHVIVHELCHMLVNEMSSSVSGNHGHEERVCTTLANAILCTRDMGNKDIT